MCGSLKRENNDKRAPNMEWGNRGDKFTITTKEGNTTQAIFNGHAQSESLDNWKAHGWKTADLHVSGYTEGMGAQKRTYEIPTGSRISCICMEVKKQGEMVHVFNIITRPAKEAETQIHDRFPVITKRRF